MAVTLAPGARFADVRSHRGEDIWIVAAGTPTFIYGSERYTVERRPHGHLPGRRRARRHEPHRRARIADRRVQHLVLVIAGSLLDRMLVQAIPVVPKAIVRPLSQRYIAGPSLDDALRTMRRLKTSGRAATVDVLGEQLTSREQIAVLVAEYRRALVAFADEGLDATLSLKMTGLGLKVDPGLCAENVRELADEARVRSLAVELDMEDSTTTDATLDLYRSLHEDGYDNVVIALQAYLRRSRDDVRSLLPLTPRVRLVKGIWIEPASVAYSDYDTIRGSYVRLLDELLAGGAFVAVASHDEWIHWQALDAIDRHGRGTNGRVPDAARRSGASRRRARRAGEPGSGLRAIRGGLACVLRPAFQGEPATGTARGRRHRRAGAPAGREMISVRFEDKIVVITGAGHGIGRATALRFAREGASVVVVDIDESGAAGTAGLISEEGGVAQTVAVDVSDEHAVASLGRRIATAYGRVDILHNNAGAAARRKRDGARG